MNWLGPSMVCVGMLLLAAALKPISTILATVGAGHLYRLWSGLGVLVLLFLVGYAAFCVLHIGQPSSIADLVVMAILMAGGFFVYVVAQLSAVTTRDIARIAVLERDVVRDSLTGLYNRRFMQEKLPEEVARAQQARRPLSALLVDLDHFKHINDTYGHPTGDLVLRHVAELIVRHSRLADTVVRYGGEEFMVIAPGVDLDEVQTLGTQTLQHIARTPLILPNGEGLAVTASIGAASLASDGNGDDLLSRADQALYAAKRDGRNCLRVLSRFQGAPAA